MQEIKLSLTIEEANLVLEGLGPADHHERVARERVHRLHPAALEDGEPPEGVEVEAADRARGDEGDGGAGEGEGARDPRDLLPEGAHAASCGAPAGAAAARRSPRRSEMAKWTRSPRVTSTVDT